MMTLVELGKILKDMYHNAPYGEAVAMIHLFGIKYADEIIGADVMPKEIIKAANLQESYATEVSKGMKLAKYVIAKD